MKEFKLMPPIEFPCVTIAIARLDGKPIKLADDETVPANRTGAAAYTNGNCPIII